MYNIFYIFINQYECHITEIYTLISFMNEYFDKKLHGRWFHIATERWNPLQKICGTTF